MLITTLTCKQAASIVEGCGHGVQKEEEDSKPLNASDVTISADALQQLRQLQDTSSLAALEEAARKQQQANGSNGGKLPKEDLERISAKLDKVSLFSSGGHSTLPACTITFQHSVSFPSTMADLSCSCAPSIHRLRLLECVS